MNRISAVTLALFLLLSFCNENETVNDTKEILIYCGITMVNPIAEIAEIIEEQENCKILITKGGSGNLYKSILTNKKGDLYLPGSKTYIEIGLNEDIIIDTVFVGKNKAVMMVQKGNPKNIEDCLISMTNENYKVVIGNPYSGSIGKETKSILDKKEIFEKVSENIEHYTTDSKDLILVLKNKEADLVINWYATSVWENNKPYVEVLDIDSAFAKEKKLFLGLLKYSKHPDIAKKFMTYASSEKGKNIFAKYGL